MEAYTLDETFQRKDLIEGFESFIWTERFIEAGDFNLVLPALPEHIANLAEGTFIELKGSDEVMPVETQSIEEGILTVTGKSVETFFNERYIRNSDDPDITSWLIRDKAGIILGTIVHDTVIESDDLGIGIGDELNAIPYLVLGPLDDSGDDVSAVVPFGPMYDALLAIAQQYKLGMAVYLSRTDAFGYEFSFTSFKGLDRTSTQFENDPVRFSPALDSMTDTKSLTSVVGYKTAVYVFPPSAHPGDAVVEFAPGSDPDAVGFARRILVIDASDISDDMITGGVTLDDLMHQKAIDALANNNFTKVFDGEVVPQPGYIYGTHYKLGDIVELVGQSGVPQRATFTEYIRSQDATGERAYPTVSVIE